MADTEHLHSKAASFRWAAPRHRERGTIYRDCAGEAGTDSARVMRGYARIEDRQAEHCEEIAQLFERLAAGEDIAS